MSGLNQRNSHRTGYPIFEHIFLVECVLHICLMLPISGVAITTVPTTAENCSSPRRTMTDECPWYVCYHGSCRVQDFPYPSCHCDAGWLGPSCDQCCDLPCIHGKCDIRENGGAAEMYCKCHGNATGTYCEVNPDPTTKSMPPMTSSPNNMGNIDEAVTEVTRSSHVTDASTTKDMAAVEAECSFPRRNTTEKCVFDTCHNGDCMSTNAMYPPHCVCDKGWGGSDCRTCCDLLCEFGKCRLARESDADSAYCECEHGFTGPLCTEKADIVKDSCSNVTTVPRKLCGDIHECYHGSCTGQPHYWCICDKVWSGRACDQCCDLACQNGTCQISSINGQPYCFCEYDFGGELCEKILVKNTTETPPSDGIYNVTIMKSGSVPNVITSFSGILFSSMWLCGAMHYM